MKRILLIDDEETEHILVKFLLEEKYGNDFDLKYASSVYEAKRYLVHEQIDVVLLDDKLEDGMTSRETLPMVQGKVPSVPIIIISKDTESPHLKEINALGQTKVVGKFRLRQELKNNLLETIYPS